MSKINFSGVLRIAVLNTLAALVVIEIKGIPHAKKICHFALLGFTKPLRD